MKQNLLAIALTLVLGGGFAFLIRSTQGESATQASESTDSQEEEGDSVVADTLDPAALDFPVAFVNFDSIQAGYERLDELNLALEKKEQQARGLVEQERTLMGDAQKVENVARNGGFTQKEYEQQVMSLQKRGEYLARQQQKLQEDVVQLQVDMSLMVNTEIRNYIRANIDKFGYRAVMYYGEGVNVIYVDPELDITAAVLSALNADYRAQKAARKPKK